MEIRVVYESLVIRDYGCFFYSFVLIKFYGGLNLCYVVLIWMVNLGLGVFFILCELVMIRGLLVES